MTTNIHTSNASVSNKRRIYSAEFKRNIVETCVESLGTLSVSTVIKKIY